MTTARADEAAHKAQYHNPTEMLMLSVEEGTTKIIAASRLDLNAIYTPFKNPSVAKNVDESFTIKDNIIFFQPKTEMPFSIYITQKGDPLAPTYKLTIGPSPIPVGQQIKMIPKVPYHPISKREKMSRANDSYPSTIIGMLSDTARMLADTTGDYRINHFVEDEEFDQPPYFIGNALVLPSKRLTSSNYEIYILDLINKSNETFELVNSDFAVINPITGEEPSENSIGAAGVGFFPNQVVQPGGATQVIIVRGI
jgi:hypothetical protein